jgi:hypothetical protein|tara:strand:- start:237 stop:413 length:177 start_codon:yes stop_codon:yes gene_type:complete
VWFELNLTIKVDPDANFLEVDPNHNLAVLGEVIQDHLYDIDDIKVIECEVKQNDYSNA